jgi:hypothetical protein
MNKITKNLCQYLQQLAWEHSYPVTNQAGRLVNQSARLPNRVKEHVGGFQLRRTRYAIMAATAILLFVVSVPIIHPVAAQSD